MVHCQVFTCRRQACTVHKHIYVFSSKRGEEKLLWRISCNNDMHVHPAVVNARMLQNSYMDRRRLSLQLGWQFDMIRHRELGRDTTHQFNCNQLPKKHLIILKIHINYLENLHNTNTSCTRYHYFYQCECIEYN